MALRRTQLIQAPGLQQDTSRSVASLMDRLQLNAGDYFNKAGMISAELGQEAGYEEGVERDDQGNLIAPELKAGITAFQQAFNKSAMDAYTSNEKADIRNDLIRIYQENADNAEKYNTKVDAYLKGVEESVHPQAKNEVFAFAQSINRDNGLRVTAADLARRRGEAIALHDKNITSAVDAAKREALNGNQIKAVEYATQAYSDIAKKLENGYINEDEAAAEQIAIKKTLFQQAMLADVRNVYQAMGESQAFEVLAEMQEEVPDDFTVEEWDALTGALVADITQQVTLQAKVRSAEEIAKDTKLSNMMILAKSGEGDMGELVNEFETAFNDPNSGISPSQRTEFYMALTNSQKQQRKVAIDMAAVAKRFAGDDFVVVDKSAVNKYYSDVLAPSGVGNDQKALFVDRTKLIPDAMKNEIRQYMMSGDPELVAQSADLADRISFMMGVEDVFSPTEKAFANAVVQFSRTMEPEKAIELAQKTTDPNNQHRVLARREEIKAGKFHEKDNEVVKDAFESGFIGSLFRNMVGAGAVKLSPVNQDRIVNEFRETRDALFIAGYGDKEDANSRALKEVGKNYGELPFAGRTLFMKYPMDKFYPSQKGTAYIAEQAQSQASELLGYDVDVNNIHFDWDSRTAREASEGKPSYLMWVIEDGSPLMIGRFAPEPELVNAAASLEREVEFAVAREKGVSRNKAQEDMAKAREEAGLNPFIYGGF